MLKAEAEAFVARFADERLGDEEIGTVTADGTSDTRRCHTAIIARQATAVIPI